MADLPNPAQILDLGCGNGEFASQLAKHGQRGAYLGLDNSPELLKIALQHIEVLDLTDIQIQFQQGRFICACVDYRSGRPENLM